MKDHNDQGPNMSRNMNMSILRAALDQDIALHKTLKKKSDRLDIITTISGFMEISFVPLTLAAIGVGIYTRFTDRTGYGEMWFVLVMSIISVFLSHLVNLLYHKKIRNIEDSIENHRRGVWHTNQTPQFSIMEDEEDTNKVHLTVVLDDVPHYLGILGKDDPIVSDIRYLAE